KYESHMKILVKNQRVDVAITPEQTTAAAVAENEVSENQINSEIELLTSKDLLTQVVQDCGLAKLEAGWFSRGAAEPVRVEKAAERRLAEFQQSNNLVVLAQQKELTLQKTAEAKAKLFESEAAINEAANRARRVEQQLAAIPKRIVTQSRALPNQYSAERLNTM